MKSIVRNKKARNSIPPLAFALIIVLIIFLVIAFVPEVRETIMEMLHIIFGR
jgi:hypothetical protein